MRYLITVLYKTPATEKVSHYMREIVDDWKKGQKELLVSKTFEFDTDEPLSDEQINDLKEKKEEWMDTIEVELITA